MDSKTLVETTVSKAEKESGFSAGHDVDPAKLRESLSALMDDEADELELRRILRALPANPELSAAWQRYHAVRASLHNEIHSRPAVNLLAGINASLAAEADAYPSAVRGRVLRSGILRYLGQGAIAASVALAALMSISLLQNGGMDAPASTVAEATVTPAVETPVLNGDYTTTASELARTVSTDPDAALEHLEQAVLREFGEVRASEQYPPVFSLDESPAE